MLSRLARVVLIVVVAISLSERLLAGGPSNVPRSATRQIHLISNGWHTALAVKPADLPARTWPIAGEFSGANYLVIGWGDADFYRAKKVTLWILFKALFLPTPSALHVMPVKGGLGASFPRCDIVEISVHEVEFKNFARHLGGAFKTNSKGTAFDLGPGFYQWSRFYLANGAYYFPKTCNVWTATALQRAGCRVLPPCALTADDLIWQTRKMGRRVQVRRKPSDAL